MKTPSVSPYIYAVQPEGELLGFQVRLKRVGMAGPRSVSRYFSLAKLGDPTTALSAAEKWRRANLRWLVDEAFELKELPARHPILNEVRRLKRERAAQGRTRKSAFGARRD